MQKQMLHSGWTLRAAGDLSEVPGNIKDKQIPATVPGCVHTDLLAAGLIDDPYIDRNELKAQWIGRTDWEYSTSFDVDSAMLAHEHVDLVCDGLDTVARVELNGSQAGDSVSMHLPQRFNVKQLLKQGRNELRITFASALNYAEVMEKKHGALPHVEKHPFNFIRKMACNFGWDWGPALITAGIWQPIGLEAWSVARIKSVRPFVRTLTTTEALIDIIVDIEGEIVHALGASATIVDPRWPQRSEDDNGEEFGRTKSVTIPLRVKDPLLWWPLGHGQQPLYKIDVSLGICDRASLCQDNWSGRIGLRTLRLNTDKDEIGSKFQLEVNGKPIFCKGANWIPDDCFPHRVDEARYRKRIQQAADANMNMLRVWGGGIYETEAFYSICDEMGIMVWQDFLFACAAYPEEEPYKSLVEAEARHHVARLAPHPSLVIWNGCNENIWGYFDWGWKQKIGDRTWGLGYYTQLLPKVVSELDPTRPYWPASPYSGSMEIHPLDDRHGNKHVWDAWNKVDYTVYRKYTPRFCSEFGHQAPPSYATIRKAIPVRQLAPDSPTMLHHQKAQGGNDKLHARLGEHFDIPDNFDDWLYLTQLNQARAIQTGVEWWRSRAPACMGALYWQINDCWPVTSWAAVDGEGRPKPLWYATRRFYANRLLTFQPLANGEVHLFAINDTDNVWRASVLSDTCSLERGGALNSPGGIIAIDVPPRSVKDIGAAPRCSAGEFLSARSPDGGQTHWFFDIDRNLKYSEPQYDASVRVDGMKYSVTITAKTLLRDLCLFADRLDENAVVNEQLVTLLPGESFTFEFESRRQLPEKALTSPPVLQCANRFGKKV